MKFRFDPEDAAGPELRDYVGRWLAVIIYADSWEQMHDHLHLGLCSFEGVVVTLSDGLTYDAAFTEARRVVEDYDGAQLFVVPLNKYRAYKAGCEPGAEDDQTSTVSQLAMDAARRAYGYEYDDGFERAKTTSPIEALQEVGQESVQDLLTDLMHLARHKGWDFPDILGSAQARFEEEV